MKKLIALLMALVMCLSLCACGKSDAVKAVQKAISEIGEVTYSSGSVITEAQQLYDELSEAEQKTVKNLDVLTEAQEKYNEIVLVPVSEMAGYIYIC